MDKKTIVAIAAILVVLGAGYAMAIPTNGFWNDMMGYGYGITNFGYHPGMMNGYGGFGMMGYNGYGFGHCGGYVSGYGEYRGR